MWWLVTVAVGLAAGWWTARPTARTVAVAAAATLVVAAALSGRSSAPVDETLVQVGRDLAVGTPVAQVAPTLDATVGRGYWRAGDGWVSAVPVEDRWTVAGLTTVRQDSSCRQARWNDGGPVTVGRCTPGSMP